VPGALGLTPGALGVVAGVLGVAAPPLGVCVTSLDCCNTACSTVTRTPFGALCKAAFSVVLFIELILVCISLTAATDAPASK
jgi:hypothetical protein